MCTSCGQCEPDLFPVKGGGPLPVHTASRKGLGVWARGSCLATADHLRDEVRVIEATARAHTPA